MFVSTKVLSRKAYFCRDKIRVLSRQIRVFSRQTRVCRDKFILVAAPANDSTVGWPGVTGYRVLPFRGVSL